MHHYPCPFCCREREPLPHCPELVSRTVLILPGLGVGVAEKGLGRLRSAAYDSASACVSVAAGLSEHLALEAGSRFSGDHVEVSSQAARLGNVERPFLHDDFLNCQHVDVGERRILSASAGPLEDPAIQQDMDVRLAETAQGDLVSVSALADHLDLYQFIREDLGQIHHRMGPEFAVSDLLHLLALGAFGYDYALDLERPSVRGHITFSSQGVRNAGGQEDERRQGRGPFYWIGF